MRSLPVNPRPRDKFEEDTVYLINYSTTRTSLELTFKEELIR